MVLGSLAPLFVLWAIRGSHEIPDQWLITFCAACVIVPNGALFLRWHIASVQNDHRIVRARSSKDQSEHFLVYLFAMLIPLFGVDVGTARDAASVFVALLFIVFIFWHMNLHYINIVFALLGYNIFTVEASMSENDSGPSRTVVVISKRHSIPVGSQFDSLRLSNTVLIEKD